MSSGVADSGRLTVFEIAPEMNGCTAAIIRMWPVCVIERVPLCGLKAQSKTGRCSSLRSGAPSMVSLASMKAMISAASASE